MENWYPDVSVAMQYQSRIKLHSSADGRRIVWYIRTDVVEEPATIFMVEEEFCHEKKIESNRFDDRILLAAAKISNLALETEVIAVIKRHVAKAHMEHDCIVKADSHIACRAHAAPLPCRVAKGLECVFPI